MHSIKHIISVQSIVLFILIACSSETAHARSVYVITDRDSTVKAYDIQGDQIVEQATAENLVDLGGAVGLALDPDSEIIFVTYEDSEMIEMLNAKTMTSEEKPVKLARSAHLYGLFANQDNKDFSGVLGVLML